MHRSIACRPSCFAPGLRFASAAASAASTLEAKGTATGTAVVTPEIVSTFYRDGIVCIPDFISSADCERLRAQALQYIEDEAARREREGDTTATVFDTESKAHADNEFFMTSGNKIRCFLEKDCTKVSPTSVNKIGHALHTDGGVFQEFCSRQKFRSLLRQFGQHRPSAIQSMYILKPPKVGGVVVPHQDSSFLNTTPMSVIGVWFALEDTTVENACLLALKGSHFTHKVDFFARLLPGSTLKQEMVGEMPKVPIEALEPIECPQGSCVVFNGQVVHGSTANLSQKSRHAFVFHSVDDRCAWDERNWIAPTVARLAL